MRETATRTDRCVKCRVEGIPDTELIITTNIGIGPGFFGVCEDCSRADGVDPAQGIPTGGAARRHPVPLVGQHRAANGPCAPTRTSDA